MPKKVFSNYLDSDTIELIQDYKKYQLISNGKKIKFRSQSQFIELAVEFFKEHITKIN